MSNRVLTIPFSGLRPRYGLTYAEIEIFGDAEIERRAGVRSRRRQHILQPRLLERSAMRKVDVQSRRRLLDDFFKVDEAEVSFERFDGSMTPAVRRLVFERGDSVAAVVFDLDAQRLLLTEQFRFPTFEKGPGWLIEIIAGMIESGEQPEKALRREIEEELGYRAGHIEHVATFYVSPGGSSERIWVYYAEVNAAGRVSVGGGLPGEHEDIRVLAMSPEEARAALREGTLADAKSIVGLQWFLTRSASQTDSR